jgi:hypothetical protein
MPSPEDIADQQDLLAAHRRTLAQYLKQRALIGAAFEPPAVGHGIDETRASIRRVKDILRGWDVPVADHPDDEQPPAPSASAPSRPSLALPWRALKRLALLIGALVLLGAMIFAGALIWRRQTSTAPALRGTAMWMVCGRAPVVLPGSITPAQDATAALGQIKAAIDGKQTDTWSVVGPDVISLYERGKDASALTLYVQLGSTVDSTLRLSNRVRASISANNVAQHVDVVSFPPPVGCGGGNFRTFSASDLARNASTYGVDPTYGENDFLTLAAREIEIFRFPFECRSPGTYAVQLLTRYEVANTGVADTVAMAAPVTAVCPQSFTYWPLIYANYDIMSNSGNLQFGPNKDYIWQDSGYVEK